jgi:hypothetical protein
MSGFPFLPSFSTEGECLVCLVVKPAVHVACMEQMRNSYKQFFFLLRLVGFWVHKACYINFNPRIMVLTFFFEVTCIFFAIVFIVQC